MSVEHNKNILLRSFEQVWNQGHVDLIDELYAPAYVEHDPQNPPVNSNQDYKQLVRAFRSAFPDIHFAVQDMVADGAKVVARWICTGTQQGQLGNLPATGRSGQANGITISRFEGDKVVESWVVWDRLGMLQQLGFVPAS